MGRRKSSWRYLLLLGLMISAMLSAQHGTISGAVVDEKTGDPLPGANILVQGLQVGTTKWAQVVGVIRLWALGLPEQVARWSRF
jgi:hypothetical protein